MRSLRSWARGVSDIGRGISEMGPMATLPARRRPAPPGIAGPWRQGPAPGRVAAELEAELVRCDRGVLRHHCPGRDFSSWIAGVYRDHQLAAGIGAAEAALPAQSQGAVVEQVRLALIAALQARHPR